MRGREPEPLEPEVSDEPEVARRLLLVRSLQVASGLGLSAVLAACRIGGVPIGVQPSSDLATSPDYNPTPGPRPEQVQDTMREVGEHQDVERWRAEMADAAHDIAVRLGVKKIVPNGMPDNNTGRSIVSINGTAGHGAKRQNVYTSWITTGPLKNMPKNKALWFEQDSHGNDRLAVRQIRLILPEYDEEGINVSYADVNDPSNKTENPLTAVSSFVVYGYTDSQGNSETNNDSVDAVLTDARQVARNVA
jgi:hypothetical protein